MDNKRDAMRFFVSLTILLVFGCSNPKQSEQLARIDELMNHHPDSAYSLIQCVNPEDLKSKSDKAFYALLYTQAQYKNYIVLKSDSLINLAVAYYRLAGHKKFDEIMLDNQHNQSSANQIIEIANKLHRNIIHRISQAEPKLSQKELLILSMTCLKFRQLEMSIYLQAPSLEATYMARQRLVKKLIVKSLEDYLLRNEMSC